MEVEVMAAKHKAASAATIATVLSDSLDVPPGWRGLVVPWPMRNGLHHEAVTMTAGFHDRSLHPGLPSEAGYEDCATELGLARTILSEQYLETMLKLVKLAGRRGAVTAVFRALTKPETGGAVRNLLIHFIHSKVPHHGISPKTARVTDVPRWPWHVCDPGRTLESPILPLQAVFLGLKSIFLSARAI